MPIAVLHEKLQTLPESCFTELFEFMEFLEYKNSQQTNGLDIAIAEEKNGDVEVFNSFDAFKVAMEK